MNDGVVMIDDGGKKAREGWELRGFNSHCLVISY